LEGDAHLGLEIAAGLPGLAPAPREWSATGRAAPGGTAEQVGQDVPEAPREPPGIEAPKPGPAGRERASAPVVLLALLRVADDVVRLLDGLEALLRVLV